MIHKSARFSAVKVAGLALSYFVCFDIHDDDLYGIIRIVATAVMCTSRSICRVHLEVTMFYI